MPFPLPHHTPARGAAPSFWPDKVVASLCYLGLGSAVSQVLEPPTFLFLLYALAYWVVVQPRRQNFSGFLRYHLLQALFAFLLLSMGVHLLVLVVHVLDNVTQLFALGPVLGFVVLPWMAALNKLAALLVAVFSVLQVLRGTWHRLLWVGAWADRLF